jgi:sensor histidine kinase regulating citrate/malate metabolism
MLKSLSHNTVSILNDIINMLEFLIDNIFDTTKAEITKHLSVTI